MADGSSSSGGPDLRRRYGPLRQGKEDAQTHGIAHVLEDTRYLGEASFRGRLHSAGTGESFFAVFLAFVPAAPMVQDLLRGRTRDFRSSGWPLSHARRSGIGSFVSAILLERFVTVEPRSRPDELAVHGRPRRHPFPVMNLPGIDVRLIGWPVDFPF